MLAATLHGLSLRQQLDSCATLFARTVASLPQSVAAFDVACAQLQHCDPSAQPVGGESSPGSRQLAFFLHNADAMQVQDFLQLITPSLDGYLNSTVKRGLRVDFIVVAIQQTDRLTVGDERQ